MHTESGMVEEFGGNWAQARTGENVGGNSEDRTRDAGAGVRRSNGEEQWGGLNEKAVWLGYVADNRKRVVREY